MTSRIANCWRRRSPSKAAAECRSLCRREAANAMLSSTPSPMRARRLAVSSPKRPRSNGFLLRWRRPSGWRRRRAASRSTTTVIFMANPVGAMIVAGPEGLRKDQYRKFNIKSADIAPGDDFGMMREVLIRRFKRLLNEKPRVGAVAQQAGASSDGGAGADRPAHPAPSAHSKSAVADFDHSIEWPKPAYKRFRLGEIRDGGAGGDGAASPSGPTPGETAPSPPSDKHAEQPWPDLLLIDGGEGQLRAARETLAGLGIVDIPIVGIAKGPDRDAGRETFHMTGREPFRLPTRDPVLYFVQRLRDEAHRFAIGSHRQRRRRDIRAAGLQEIAGIGPTRKRALLRHFGTLKAVERASISDLTQVSGISAETARRIYDFFHESAD